MKTEMKSIGITRMALFTTPACYRAKKLSLVNARAQRLSVPFGYLLMILATTVYSTTSLRRPSYLKDGLKVDEASPCMTSTYKCNISVL